MTRNSISPRPPLLLAAVAAAALAVPAAAGSFGTAMSRQDGPVPSAMQAPPSGQGIADQLPGIAGEEGTAGQSLVAQYSPIPPRGRPISDHDHARESTRAGENRGFEELMRSAQSRGRGEYLGVEPDIGRNVYRFKFLRAGGNVVWVDVDGRTGRVIAERD